MSDSIVRFSNSYNTNKGTGCWDWIKSLTHNGYGRFAQSRNKSVRAHRWSYEYFIGHIPEGLLVIHNCDNPKCVNPDHLRTGTQKDNMRQMYGAGRWPKQKLTPDDAVEIRRMYASGDYLQREIAEVYGVTQHHVSAIIKGRFWNGY